MPRILVTGAGGFLGRRLARHLAACDHEVVALGRSALLRDALRDGRITVKTCDLADAASLSALEIEGVDAIVHCAGLSSNWGPRRDFERNNVTATASLLAQARRWGRPHFIYVSSSSVYFSFRDRLNVGETSALPAPVNHYAWSKVAAEQFVGSAADLPWTIVRPRGIYGAGDRALLPRLLRAARRGPLPSFNGGRAVIDLTHVDDVVAAIARVLDHRDRATGAVYNVSGGEAVSIRDIITRSAALSGLDVRWRELPWPVALTAIRAIEGFHTLFRPQVEPVVTAYTAGLLAFSQTLDLSAIRNDIGWTPGITFAEGLQRTFAGDQAA
ncbi:NAD-dependent epimerase/dehydratase family protein [Bradyrhizobium manausense]|uniref:NAD-dependent epimerase/dehydratase family protein n=1 Tax=Bradyrhizobium manausense TaxID=989370 RepID=UPI001BA82B21|nr:NAD(P)-dependent oxidoreductase [Bradyrhizobium manausense]MBR0724091.1 NAD(P)-dependent oxidoreductase [Bradyrhizobium manausense]